MVVEDDHKVIYCPTIAARGRESKQVAPSAPKEDAPIHRHFYALQARGSKPYENESDDDVGNLSFLLVVILSPFKGGSVVSKCDRMI